MEWKVNFNESGTEAGERQRLQLGGAFNCSTKLRHSSHFQTE